MGQPIHGKIFYPEKLIKSHSECKEETVDVREGGFPLFWWLQGKYGPMRSNGTSKQSFSVNWVRSGTENSGGHSWSPTGGRSISHFSPVVSELDFWGNGLPARTFFKTDSFGDFMGPHDYLQMNLSVVTENMSLIPVTRPHCVLCTWALHWHIELWFFVLPCELQVLYTLLISFLLLA